MKATEQYFPVVLFIMLYKVVLTFETVGENLWWTIQIKPLCQYFCMVHVPVVFQYFTKQNLRFFSICYWNSWESRGALCKS